MRKGGKIDVKYLNKLLNESYKDKEKTNANIDDRYILDNELSTNKTKVYLDKKNNNITMVNRGTSDKKDVITDAKLLMGYKDKNRFNEARAILDKVKNKYTDKSIDLLGHSLGATIAEDLGADDRVKNVITLNKPTTPYQLFKKNKISNKQYDIRNRGDLVSALAPFQKSDKDIILENKSFNPYTNHKIETLDELDQDMVIGEGLNLNAYFAKLLIEGLKRMI